MNTLNFKLLTECMAFQRTKENKMDLEYFIRDAKDNYSKNLEFVDLMDIMADSKDDLVQSLMEAMQLGNSGEIGIAVQDMIDAHIKKPNVDRLIQEEAEVNYRDFLEDQNAEAEENKRAA